MIVPYPDAASLSQEDAFNFWLSNSRIQIECTFGEFIGRFGLFWRTLKFDTDVSCNIIRSASLLHNFLVDCREGTADKDVSFLSNLSHSDVEAMDRECPPDERDFTDPMVSDNNAPKPAGRPTYDVVDNNKRGSTLRDRLCSDLFEEDLGRPMQNKMRRNGFGHVYFVD